MVTEISDRESLPIGQIEPNSIRSIFFSSLVLAERLLPVLELVFDHRGITSSMHFVSIEEMFRRENEKRMDSNRRRTTTERTETILQTGEHSSTIRRKERAHKTSGKFFSGRERLDLRLDSQVVPWPISTHRFLSNLNVEDYSVINNINHSYDQWALQCDTEHIKYYSLERTSLVHFLNDEQQMFRSLIDFYKQVPEFRRIPIDDQVLLIKCNLTHLVHVHHVLKDQFTENTHIGRLMSRWISPSFHNQMSRARRTYDYFLKHPMILKLSLVVLIFTVNLSRLPDEDLHNELLARRSLGNCQELYVTLLWNYLNAIFDERGAVQSMGLLVFQYLRYQRLMNEMDLFIVEHFHPAQFHPLTKSAFRLP